MPVSFRLAASGEVSVHAAAQMPSNLTKGRLKLKSQKGRRLLHPYFDRAADSIYVLDSKTGRILDANNRATQMLGYSRDELLKISARDIEVALSPDTIDVIHQRTEQEIVAVEGTHRRKDGSTFPVEVRLASLAPEQPHRVLAIVRDVTARKRTLEALRQQAALLDLAHNAIFTLDSEGRITYWNEGAARRYGWSKEEALGKLAHTLLQTQFPEPHEKIEDTLMRMGRWEGELVHTCRDGRRITVDSRWAVQRDTKGDGFRILEINNDITERKRAEEALRDEAKRKDEFLALLGHELRNPLAAISTAMHVLAGDPAAEQRRSLTEMMSRQVVLMRRLLDDLLDLRRITHGKIELKKECIDFVEFLHKAAASVGSAVASRRQRLILRLPTESVRFMADRTRLEQIATNLLGNASKYTGQGGRIELSGGREGSEVILRCKDNGRGILPDMHQRIFEPFTRGVTTTDSPGEASLGIGLALVKHLTELHGGTISVESAGAGMGSEFAVRLPLVAPSSNQAAPVGSKSAPPSRQMHSIVVVEDNPAVAKVMETALEQAGHEVHVFSDGPSALLGVFGLKPGAVVLDIGLPGMDGYELAAKLKKQKNVRNALFIAVSGFKRRERAGKARDDFDHYFTKPVDIRALLALLGARPSRATAGAAIKRRERGKSNQLRALLVEDHAGLATATSNLLRSEGLEVRTAFTGREALEAAPNFRPQLVLCDMNLPDMKGLAVIRSLRSIPSTRDTHAVILTAISETEIRAYKGAAKGLGVDAFMSKPITVEAVRALVGKLKPQQRSSCQDSRDALGSP